MVIVGRVKIPYNDLFLLTKREIDAVIRGHEIDIRDSWERERISTYINVSPNFKKGSNITPQKLIPLPWDKTIDINLNKDKLKSDIEKAKEIYAKLKMKKENGKS
jgi:hypothetical protein